MATDIQVPTEELLEKIRSARQERQYAQAVALCEQVPDDPQLVSLRKKLVQLQKVFALVAQGPEALASEDALRSIQAAMDLKPLPQKELDPWTIVRQERDALREAESAAREALSKRILEEIRSLTETAEPNRERAFKQALEKLQQAREQDRENAELEQKLQEIKAWIAKLQGARETMEAAQSAFARQDYQRAAQQYKIAADAYQELGLLEQSGQIEGRLQEAQEYAEINSLWADGSSILAVDPSKALELFGEAWEKAQPYDDLRDKAQQRLRQAEDYAEAMKRGQTALEQKNYTAALHCFEQAIACLPGDLQTRQKIEQVQAVRRELEDTFSRGEQFLRQEAWDEAGDLAWTLLETHQDHKDVQAFCQDVFVRLISALLDRKDFEPAQYELARIEQAFPDMSKLAEFKEQVSVGPQVMQLLSEGDRAYEAKDYDSAIKHYERAMHLGAHYPWFPTQVSERLRQARAAQDATWRLSQAKRTREELREKRDWGSIVAYCEELLQDAALDTELDPELRDKILQWRQEAEQNLEQVQASLQQAARLMQEEEYAQAQERYREALRLSPNCAEAETGRQQAGDQNRLSVLLEQAEGALEMRSFEQAAQRLQDASEIADAYPSWQSRLSPLTTFIEYCQRAEQSRLQGDLEESVQLLQQALQARPDDQETSAFLRQTIQDIRTLDDNLQAGLEALAQARDAYKGERDEESEVYLEEAEQHFRTVLGIAPNHPVGQENFAQVETLRQRLSMVHQVSALYGEGDYAAALSLLGSLPELDERLQRQYERCQQKLEDKNRALLSELRSQAETAWARSDYPQVRRLYREILDLDPTAVQARDRLAQVERESSLHREVMELFQQGEAALQSKLDRTDIRKAKEYFRNAWERVLAEGQLDGRIEGMLRTVWMEWDEFDFLSPEDDREEKDSIDNLIKKMSKTLREARQLYQSGSQGRQTALLLKITDRLFNSAWLSDSLDQTYSAVTANDLEDALVKAERHMHREPGNELFRKAYTTILNDYRGVQSDRAAKRIEWGKNALKRGECKGAVEHFEKAANLPRLPTDLKESADYWKEEAERLQEIQEGLEKARAQAQAGLDRGEYQEALESLEQSESVREAEAMLQRLSTRVEQAQAEGQDADEQDQVLWSALRAILTNVNQLVENCKREEQRAQENILKELINEGHALQGSKEPSDEALTKVIEGLELALQAQPGHQKGQALLETLTSQREAFRDWQDEYNKGKAARDAGQWKEAVEAFEKAAVLRPYDCETMQALWDARKKQEDEKNKREEKARLQEEWDKTQKEIKDLATKARQSFLKDDYVGAVDFFSQLLGRYPNHPEAESWRKELDEAKGKKDAAEKEQLRRQVEVRRLRSQAKTAKDRRDFRTAEGYLKQALERDPGNEEIEQELEDVWSKQEQAENARRNLRKAQESLRNRQYAEARQRAQSVLENDPGNPEAFSIEQQSDWLDRLQLALDSEDYIQARSYLNRLRVLKNLQVSPTLLVKLEQRIEEEELLYQQFAETVAQVEKLLQSYESYQDYPRIGMQDRDLLERAKRALDAYREQVEALSPSKEGRIAELEQRIAQNSQDLILAAQLAEEATQHWNEQSYQQAQKVLDEALGVEPRYAEAKELALLVSDMLRAQQALQERDFVRALSICERVLNDGRGGLNFTTLYEQIKAREKNAHEADQLLSNIHELLQRPPSLDVAETLKQDLLAARQKDAGHPFLQDAERNLEIEIKEFEENAQRIDTWLRQAESALQTQEIKEAISLCDQVLALVADNPKAPALKARAEKTLLFEQAKAEAIKLRDEGKWSEAKDRVRIALGYAEAGQEDQLDTLMDEIEVAEEQEEFWQAFEAGDDLQADKCLQEMLSKRPEQLELEQIQDLLDFVQRAQSVLEEQHYGEGLGLLRQARVLAPSSRRVVSLQEASWSAAGLPDQVQQARDLIAEQEYEKAITLVLHLKALDASYPEIVQLEEGFWGQLQEKADQARSAQRYSEAIEFCRYILRLRPDYPPAVQQQQEISEERDRRLKDALDQVKSFLDQAHLAKAQQALEQLRVLDPKHAELRELEQRLKTRQQELRTLDDLLSTAREALKARQYPKARELFDQVIIRDCEHPTVPTWLQFTTFLQEGTQLLLQANPQFAEAADYFAQAAHLDWPEGIPEEVDEARNMVELARRGADLEKQAQQIKDEAEQERLRGNFSKAKELFKKSAELSEQASGLFTL